ncbi:hypothetical protein [Corynebacterium mayonis]|uniref:hypothetical protein n=1 Tax=Corynebacterium mayonis TaxID=3062461 RepID=UPI0031407CD9
MKKLPAVFLAAALSLTSLSGVSAPTVSAQSGGAGEVLQGLSSGSSSGSSGNKDNLPPNVPQPPAQTPLGSAYTGSAPLSLAIAAGIIAAIGALAVNVAQIYFGFELPNVQDILRQFQM